MLDRRIAATMLVVLLGCRTAFYTKPVSASEVRAMTERVDVEGETALQVGIVTERGSVGTNLKVRDVAEACRPDRTTTARPHPPRVFDGCLLDDPRFTWEVGATRRVADPVPIVRGALVLGLVGGLVYGNVECFAGSCGTGAKVAVGIGDGLVVVGLVGIVVFLNVMSHYD